MALSPDFENAPTIGGRNQQRTERDPASYLKDPRNKQDKAAKKPPGSWHIDPEPEKVRIADSCREFKKKQL